MKKLLMQNLKKKITTKSDSDKKPDKELSGKEISQKRPQEEKNIVREVWLAS